MLKKRDINFDWCYIPDFREEYLSPRFDDSHFEEVQIPHANVEIPFSNFDERIYQFESCYRKRLMVEPLEAGERLYIRFEAVMAYARIFLNGSFVGEHKGGYTPFRIDLTGLAVPGGDNVLVVHVDSRERPDIPPFGFVIDYLTYGGIYREVSLQYVHDIHCETLAVRTKEVLSGNPVLEADLYFRNHRNSAALLEGRFRLIHREETVAEFRRELQLSGPREETIRIDAPVWNIVLWDTDSPELYELEVTLFREDKQIGKQRVRFGFRDIRFNSKGFYLNGRKVKIRGLNRHQSFPYVGYAMPKNAQYCDADILKYELGVNAVRLSHYPQSDHFLDRCDELGLLVFDEIPGWQHIGDEAWQDLAVENVREMILKDINHPSVIIWGVRINESQDSDRFYKKTNAMARSLDDTRPTGGVRCIRNSRLFEDVYTYNDFIHNGRNRGLDKKRKVTKTKGGYLVTEHNGHMFPTKKYDNETHRVSQALRHLKVLDAMEGDDRIAGAFGWCMFDYNTHKDFGSGDKICHHGVMDMFRIPKHAAFAYQSQQDEMPVMYVAGSLNIGEYEGSLLQSIPVFTNCDFVRLYRNGEVIGDFHPRKDLYPHVPHAPVIIDDFVGDAIRKNESFSRADADLVKKLLTIISAKGPHLNLWQMLRMGWILLKYRMNTRDAEDLYTKYFGGWGSESTDYRFEGFRDGECQCETEINQLSTPRLEVRADTAVLKEEATWDAVRVVVSLEDDWGNPLVYSQEAIYILREGPVRIIGPTIIPLIGGSTGFWVRSCGKSGTGKISVLSERFGKADLTFQVTAYCPTDPA